MNRVFDEHVSMNTVFDEQFLMKMFIDEQFSMKMFIDEQFSMNLFIDEQFSVSRRPTQIIYCRACQAALRAGQPIFFPNENIRCSTCFEIHKCIYVYDDLKGFCQRVCSYPD
jgi:hypothetical protein